MTVQDVTFNKDCTHISQGSTQKQRLQKIHWRMHKYIQFYYANKNENKDKTNCMEHIAQGFVSMEPLSSVSG